MLDDAAVVSLTQELVRIPSVSPSLAPGEGHCEQAVAEFAVRWLTEHGVEAWLDPVVPGRPNAVARVGRGDGPTLVICGHTDTVHTAGMRIAPFDPVIEGDRLYGRGSYDMKGALAAAMVAAASLGDRLKGTLLLALVSDEEHLSLGAEAFVGKYRADGCLIAEPTDLTVQVGHRGFAWLDVRVAGRAAHGSRWDLGVSANYRAGRLLAALEKFDGDVLRSRTHPVLGPSSMHPSFVRGGVGLSTYAPECLLQLEWRILPGQSEADLVAEMEALVRQVGVDATVECTFFRPPLYCPPEAPVKQALLSALDGRPAPEGAAPWWTDGAIFAGAGIDAVLYGPAGGGIHTEVEWVDLPSLLQCAEVYRRMALTFCGESRGSVGLI
jgi:acetylornithine deacetylase